MLKITMCNGEEYEVNYKTVQEFIDQYTNGDGILPSKLVSIGDNVSVNLSQIATVAVEKYINDINTIIP